MFLVPSIVVVSSHLDLQVRTLNFLTMLMRNFPVELEPHMQGISSSLFYLFRSAPDSIAVRRELLAATRCMVSGPQKNVCFAGVIGDVLEEGVLLGSSMASMDALKPVSVSGSRCLLFTYDMCMSSIRATGSWMSSMHSMTGPSVPLLWCHHFDSCGQSHDLFVNLQFLSCMS